MERRRSGALVTDAAASMSAFTKALADWVDGATHEAARFHALVHAFGCSSVSLGQAPEELRRLWDQYTNGGGVAVSLWAAAEFVGYAARALRGGLP